MKIEGSFYQPFERVNKTSTQLDWDRDHWKQELNWMKEVGMDLLIIQFCVYEGRAYYPTTLYPQAGHNDQVENILSEAEKIGMKVMVGLTLDNQWWKGINSEEYIQQELAMNKKLAKDLWDKYGHYKSFWGWYIPHEIDDWGAEPENVRQLISKLLGELSASLKELTPGKPIGIAPYYSMRMTPEAYENWWIKTLESSGIDIVMLQDGVGCHRPDMEKEITPYFQALASACRKTNVHFWTDLEIFNQIHCHPVDDWPVEKWDAIPADMGRIARQIELQEPWVEKIVIFEFTHYMSPQMGENEKTLYKDYKNYLINKGELQKSM